VQVEFVAPKLAHEERRLEQLRAELVGSSGKSGTRLASQEAFVDQLRAFLDDLKCLSLLWRPNLDDGIVINFAPLWRLVPHHKAWQKELKATWDSLCRGEYEWTHLAMHLWPERVVPKCATDRSVAISHGLEDVFWMEPKAGKWIPRTTPTRSVDDLVAERTLASVKAALSDLLSVETPGGFGRTRGR